MLHWKLEFIVGIGKGYVAANQNRPEDAPIGLIPIDSLFSPLSKFLIELIMLVLGK